MNEERLQRDYQIYSIIAKPKDKSDDSIKAGEHNSFENFQEFLKAEKGKLIALNKEAEKHPENYYIYCGYEEMFQDQDSKNFNNILEEMAGFSATYPKIIFSPGSFYVLDEIPEVHAKQDKRKFYTTKAAINIAPTFYGGKLVHIEQKGCKLKSKIQTKRGLITGKDIDKVSTLEEGDEVECPQYHEDELSSGKYNDPLFIGTTKMECQKQINLDIIEPNLLDKNDNFDELYSDSFKIRDINIQLHICADHRTKDIKQDTDLYILVSNGQGLSRNEVNGKLYIHCDYDGNMNRTNTNEFKEESEKSKLLDSFAPLKPAESGTLATETPKAHGINSQSTDDNTKKNQKKNNQGCCVIM